MKVKSKRLSKFLYSLGFDKQSKFENNNEIWLYKKSKELDEALDFYFTFRDKMNKLQENKVNEQRKIFDISNNSSSNSV